MSTEAENTGWEEQFEQFLFDDFDNPPEKQTHRWIFCADTHEIAHGDTMYDCGCCLMSPKIEHYGCLCVCHKRIEQLKSFILSLLQEQREEIVKEMDGMKKKPGCGCPPFRALHEGFCWTEEFENEASGWNKALDHAIALIRSKKEGI